MRAIGAVVGESVADLMKKRTNDQKLISDVSSGLAAGLAGLAGLAGYDVNTAQESANIAIKENAFWVPLIAAVVIADRAYSAYQISKDINDLVNGSKTLEQLTKEKGQDYITKAIVGNLGKKG